MKNVISENPAKWEPSSMGSSPSSTTEKPIFATKQIQLFLMEKKYFNKQ
jgi:hypothetical protein